MDFPFFVLHRHAAPATPATPAAHGKTLALSCAGGIGKGLRQHEEDYPQQIEISLDLTKKNGDFMIHGDFMAGNILSSNMAGKSLSSMEVSTGKSMISG